jgi:hypothetical protein
VNEAVVSPLDPAARVGDEWRSPVMTPLPNAQLHAPAGLRLGNGHFRFEGREQCRGRSCYVIVKIVSLSLDELRPQDLITAEYADYFDQTKVRLRQTGQMCVVRTWVDETTHLPVKTELNTSTSFWWTDRREEDWFISDHDHRVFEDRREKLRVSIIGRLLVAEFD